MRFLCVLCALCVSVVNLISGCAATRQAEQLIQARDDHRAGVLDDDGFARKVAGIVGAEYRDSADLIAASAATLARAQGERSFEAGLTAAGESLATELNPLKAALTGITAGLRENRESAPDLQELLLYIIAVVLGGNAAQSGLLALWRRKNGPRAPSDQPGSTGPPAG